LESLLGALGFVIIITAIFGGGHIIEMAQKTLENRAQIKLLKAQQEVEKQRFGQIREILTDAVLTGEPVSIEAIKPITEALARQIDHSNIPKQLKE